jgi:EAL domain-containing protein (putative c-di-GMP-specific phosphodiesterase class I)
VEQSFVRDIGTAPNDTALITANIAMANSLHLKAVAEGGTWQQAQFLQAIGCLVLYRVPGSVVERRLSVL